MIKSRYNLTKSFGQIFLMIILIIFIFIQSASTVYSQNTPLVTITVIPPMYVSIVDLIGGGLVKAVSPIPPGVDPHTYEGTPQDIQNALKTDLVIVDVIGHLPIASKLVDAAKSSGKPYIILFDELIKRDWRPLKKPSGTDNLHIDMDKNVMIFFVEIVREEILKIIREKYPQSYEQASLIINISSQNMINIINSTYTYAESKIKSYNIDKIALYSTASQYLANSIGIDPVYILLEEPEQEPTLQSIEALKNSGARCILILQGQEEYTNVILERIQSIGVKPVIVNVREAILKGVPYLIPVIVADKLVSECSYASSPQINTRSLYTDPYFIALATYSIIVTVLLIAYIFHIRRSRSLRR